MSDNHSFEQVKVVKKANVYGEKCVSHTLFLPDGTRKSLGVIFPANLSFSTDAAEIMELIAGACRYRLEGGEWQTASAGERFAIPARSSFEIEVAGDPLHYVCHFAS